MRGQVLNTEKYLLFFWGVREWKWFSVSCGDLWTRQPFNFSETEPTRIPCDVGVFF